MDFPGIDGFLGTRASVMLDVVALAMLAVVPAMVVGVGLARYRQQWGWHKRVQLVIAFLLLIAVIAFEVDMRFFTDWELRAEPSPYFDAAAKWSCPVGIALAVHLCFSVPTTFIWIYLVSGALRHFPRSPEPGAYSRRHRLWGRIAAIELLMTAVTGWVFYWLAFVA